jgi:hypothetical protein
MAFFYGYAFARTAVDRLHQFTNESCATEKAAEGGCPDYRGSGD